ncbi:endolytic transglycosylase MltG [Candidatus Aerophobetes bacterium]|nr:endolytic transglycosylase MltG [Candidatus Aerophobetes bacterium]
MWSEFFSKIGKIVVIFLIILVTSYFFLPTFSQKKIVVEIPKRADSEKISQILWKNKVIPNPYFFCLVVKLLRWETDLKAGIYEFESPSLLSVLDKLKNGKVKLYRVTIPEGLPKWRVAQILSEKKIVDREDFLKAVDHPGRFYTQFPWLYSTKSLEGYLFPDTYYFPREDNVDKVIERFLTRFEKVVLPIYYKYKKDKKNNLSLREVVTLASIVEKEARINSEKPIIAAVFFNRLRKGMRLRADPTVKYALGSFRKRLKKSTLDYPSPYNTYLYYGLPPGPICSPGVKSIRAVLYPANVDYLYFVAKGDGTHKFSRTYKEHLRAVALYQRG